MPPIIKENKYFMLVNGIFYGLVEQNPPLTLRKFIKHNLPERIQQLKKEAEKKDPN